MDPLRESPQEPVPAHGTRSCSPDSGGAELPWWRRITLLISERVPHIVAPADATLRLLAFDPIASATTLQARLRRLPVFVRLLEQNALLSAVFIGYSDGQFLLMRPLRNAALRARLQAPAEAAFLVQSMARERSAAGLMGLVGRWNYYDAQLRL